LIPHNGNLLMPDPHAPAREAFARFELRGKVALLTGATGHLGKSMAQALATAGAHVVLNARHRDALESLSADLNSHGGSSSTACFDVTDAPTSEAQIGKIAETYGHLDVLVNNANTGRPGTFESATAEDFDTAYRVNVVAAFQLLQLSLPLLKRSAERTTAGASVINIASMYGTVSPDPSIYGVSGANNPPYYGAAKSGLIQLTRYAACHLARYRIRVNCISPGPFPSSHFLERDPEFATRLAAKVPLGRIGNPEELQGPLLFLASDASSYVTGANLAVDGGWTAW
jgi:NAD(P)-dependent dehydrogenase (short-subunit alcohol dehydrogenase family)